MKIEIAIADDHPLVVTGIQFLLSNYPDMHVCGSYANGKELLAGLAEKQPDVLLLDIQMPGQTGDELAEIVTVRYPAIKIIALTNQDNIYYIKTMLSKGVMGYVLKTAGEEILLNAVRSVYGGKLYLEPSLGELLKNDSIHTNRKATALPILTRREREVLEQLTKNLTSQQIADVLFISRKTVESHRQGLLLKLDVKNSAALIMKAMQLGLIK